MLDVVHVTSDVENLLVDVNHHLVLVVRTLAAYTANFVIDRIATDVPRPSSLELSWPLDGRAVASCCTQLHGLAMLLWLSFVLFGTLPLLFRSFFRSFPGTAISRHLLCYSSQGRGVQYTIVVTNIVQSPRVVQSPRAVRSLVSPPASTNHFNSCFPCFSSSSWLLCRVVRKPTC